MNQRHDTTFLQLVLSIPRIIIRAYRRMPIKIHYQLLITIGLASMLVLGQYAEYLSYSDRESKFMLGMIFFSYWGSWSVWIILGPLVMEVIYLFFGRKPGENGGHWFKAMLLTLLILVLHRLMGTSIIRYCYYIFENEPFPNLFSRAMLLQMSLTLLWSLIIFLIVAAFLFGLQYYRWALAQEKELANAKLNALVMQLRPHFLFNTLNSIASLVDIDSKGAQRMLAQLGFLLRKMLDQSEPSGGLVTVEEELKFIRNYLDIEQVRFQDRLTVHYHIAPDTEQALVPYLIVQPLVENAIKHGVASLTENGELHLRTRNVSDGKDLFLELEVADNGPGAPDSLRHSKGVGLRNIRGRLHQRYGKAASLTLGPCPSGKGLSAIIHLPYSLITETDYDTDPDR